jgi:lipopolysaccharide biosynthesis glycosyltransferase
MIISMAFNKKYLLPAMVAIHSLQKNTREPITFFFGLERKFFPSGLPKVFSKFAQALELQYKIFWIEIPEYFENDGHISTSTFSKLLLADLIPDSHLWVDSDMVALRGFDSSTFGLDQSGIGLVRHSDMGHGLPEELNERMVFNAGLIVFDNSPRLDWGPYAVANSENLLFGDQEIFNMIYLNRTKSLPGILNANFSISKAQIIANAVIAHFPGSQKPWHVTGVAMAQCKSDKCGFVSWWDAYETMTKDLTPYLKSWDLILLKLASSAANQNIRAAMLSAGLHFAPTLVKKLAHSGVHPISEA